MQKLSQVRHSRLVVAPTVLRTAATFRSTFCLLVLRLSWQMVGFSKRKSCFRKAFLSHLLCTTPSPSVAIGATRRDSSITVHASSVRLIS
jgi:hypothetical protein